MAMGFEEMIRSHSIHWYYWVIGGFIWLIGLLLLYAAIEKYLLWAKVLLRNRQKSFIKTCKLIFNFSAILILGFGFILQLVVAGVIIVLVYLSYFH